MAEDSNDINTNVPQKGIQIRVRKKWEVHFPRPDGTEQVITATNRAELMRKVAKALGKQK